MVGGAEEGRVCFCPSHTGLPVRWIPKESASGSPWYSLYGSSSGGRGCVAGSWCLASQVKAHSLSPGTLAAGPQHMPENTAKMVRRGPRLTTPCIRQILLCPQAQYRRQTPGPGLHRALCVPDCPTQPPHPSRPPCQALQLKATVCSLAGPSGASASA